MRALFRINNTLRAENFSSPGDLRFPMPPFPPIAFGSPRHPPLRRLPAWGGTRKEAFTLLELLASIVLLGLLTVLTHQMVSQISASSQRSMETVKSRALARGLLDQISWDLSFATPPLPDRYALYPRLRLTPDGAPYANPHLLLFQTDRGADTLQQLVYFVRTDGKPVFCRAAFAPPVGTGGALPVIYESRDLWLTQTFLDSVVPPNGDAGVLSRRVVAFWARALDHDGYPITRDAAGKSVGYAFDSDAGYQDHQNAVYPGPAYPAAVEVALVVAQENALPFVTELQRPAVAPEDPLRFDDEIEGFLTIQSPLLRERLQVWRRTIPLECYPPQRPAPTP